MAPFPDGDPDPGWIEKILADEDYEQDSTTSGKVEQAGFNIETDTARLENLFDSRKLVWFHLVRAPGAFTGTYSYGTLKRSFFCICLKGLF